DGASNEGELCRSPTRAAARDLTRQHCRKRVVEECVPTLSDALIREQTKKWSASPPHVIPQQELESMIQAEFQQWGNYIMSGGTISQA
ncbi:unnamed protein product, partial [Amoebophrya sp. A25]